MKSEGRDPFDASTMDTDALVFYALYGGLDGRDFGDEQGGEHLPGCFGYPAKLVELKKIMTRQMRDTLVCAGIYAALSGLALVAVPTGMLGGYGLGVLVGAGLMADRLRPRLVAIPLTSGAAMGLFLVKTFFTEPSPPAGELLTVANLYWVTGVFGHAGLALLILAFVPRFASRESTLGPLSPHR